ncbi:AbrB family transcriptional regulator [Rhodovibrionaceae bacterium A322]
MELQGKKRLFAICLALVLGALGGYMAFLLRIPLPWMIGSMLVTTVAALSGAPIAQAPPLRTAMIIVLGVMLGSGFTPEILDSLDRWSISLAAVALYILVSTGLGYLYFTRLCRHDPVTSYFSAAPGGLSEMIAVGSEMGGDGRVISLMHTLRILLVVMTLPLALRWLNDLNAADQPLPGPDLSSVGLLDMAALVACGVVGYFAARALRVPAAAVVGPMVVSATVHLMGLTDAKPPFEIVAAAQVAVGAAIGARFSGTALSLVLKSLKQAVGATVILLAITLIFSLALSFLIDEQLEALILAFAPGGLAEMSLIAIALQADAAFVATHHIVRIFLIVILAPLTFKLLASRKQAAKDKGAP